MKIRKWTKSMLSAEQLQVITWDGDSHFLPGRIKERLDPALKKILDTTHQKSLTKQL